MFLTQAQSVVNVLVTMCMFSGFIRTKMFKKIRIISFIIIIIIIIICVFNSSWV